MKGFSKLAWGALALLGAFCLGTIALRRGEQINALWIVVAAVPSTWSPIVTTACSSPKR